MKHSRISSKALALFLSVVMLMSVVPFSMLSAAAYNRDFVSETHDVFKHTEQTLAPGVSNYTNYAYSKDGKQMVYYVTTADLNHTDENGNKDVIVQVAYKDMQCDVYGMDKLSNMVACANAKYSDPENPNFISKNYTVVSATNGDGYNMTTGEPGGVFILDGVMKKDWDMASNPVFLAILEDGSAVIANTKQEWDACKQAGIAQAIDIFGSNLVWDGKDVTSSASGSYDTDRHSRTMVGVTADGKLVCAVLDGRQEPFSCGGSMHELAQIMLEAGCERAFNLDGGGSTTFMAKNEGSDNCTVINRPSDGSERSISNGIIIASTAASSDEFDHVSMVAKNEYVTPGSSTEVTITGVSPAGTAAEIPENISYNVSNGTFENGALTAEAVGEVILTAEYDGKPVGSVSINAVIPENIRFSAENITVPFEKTAKLEMVATYGLNEVVTKESDFSFALENSRIGTIEGLSFTACAESVGVTASSITATFAGTEIQASASITLGKGSEVIFDFEDGTTNGFETGYSAYNYYLPKGRTYVATKENGKVHSGNYSLAVNIDYSNSQESGYMMSALYRTNPDGDNQTIYYKGAQTIGTWIYIPDEYVGLWLRWVLFPVSSYDGEGNAVEAGASITSNAMDGGAGGTGVVYSFSESGWHYLSCDFSKYAGATWHDGYYFMQFYVSDRDGADYGYYTRNHHNINGNFTVYLDDITVDYSSVIDDREAPIFSAVNYATQGMSDAAVLNDGASIADNTVDFSAAVAENTEKINASGIDAASAKAYVDGNEVACTYLNGSINLDESVALSAGKHTVKFSINDNQGNKASIIRKLNITGGEASEVKVVAHDASLDRILFGSLYYTDIVAKDISRIDTVTTTLNLDSMSKWELEHMVVADGFEASYDYEEADKILKLTVKRTGDVTATGEQALVSIPVRVWELKNVGSKIGGSNSVLEEGNEYTYSWFKSQNEYWKVAVEVRVEQGFVLLTDNTTDTFTGESVYCDTEAWAIQKFMIETQAGKDYKAAWDGGHIHTAEAVADLAATCTESGYTGRTYCDACKSVVDWGTEQSATGHTYDFTDGVLRCECGELFSGEHEGKQYADGVALQGWSGESYYVDGKKLTGISSIEGIYYDFGDDGVCVDKMKYTGLFFDGETYRYAQFGEITSGWKEIEGEWYFFDSKTKAPVETYFNGEVTYEFEENGKIVEGVWKTTAQGTRYFYGPAYHKCNSTTSNASWVTVDGNVYAFDHSGYRFEGVHYFLESNGKHYVWYDFGTDGIKGDRWTGFAKDDIGRIWYCVDGLAVAEGTLSSKGEMIFKNGVFNDYLYIDGVRQNAYQVVKYDGNYYFVYDGNKIAKNVRLYLSEVYASSAGLSVGYYEFDGEGKLAVKNGPQADGYFYRSGVKQQAYQLVEFEGNYYFINDYNKYAKSQRIYLSERFVEGTGLKVGYYEFDSEGKLVIKNGPQADGFFYLNGLKQPAYQLVEFEGNYYFINDGHKIAKDQRIYLSERFIKGTDLKVGYYEFDSEGKLVIKNGPQADGYFYLNGLKQPAYQLVEFEGDYYFINDYNKYAKSQRIYLSEGFIQGTGLKVGYYDFDSEGKLVIKNGPQADGYLYLNGVKQLAYQLVEFEGDYYFINDYNKYAKSQRIYLSESFVKGTGLKVGYHEFDSEGKLVMKNGPQADGYFYLKDVKQLAYQLVEFEGDYYFINDGHKLAKSQRIYLSQRFIEGTNLKVGYYEFDADGKMILNK